MSWRFCIRLASMALWSLAGVETKGSGAPAVEVGFWMLVLVLGLSFLPILVQLLESSSVPLVLKEATGLQGASEGGTGGKPSDSDMVTNESTNTPADI